MLGFTDLMMDQNFQFDVIGWESFSKKDFLATRILVMMEFLILLYHETCMVLGVGVFSLSEHTLSPGDVPLDVIGNPRCGRLD